MRTSIFAAILIALTAIAALGQSATQGQLEVIGEDGKVKGPVPLKHTSVNAEISGFLSRVTVKQHFENSFDQKIEAVYVFPLPDAAAVDRMVMRIGERTVRGKVMKREEARAVYEAAKSNGQIASLLDQERPNIFTQSVANILPGEKIVIEISYVETLKYEDGAYEFVFPMVVGPRYIPGDPTGTGNGFGPNTNQVPDGSKITPKVAKDRAGHDISLSVNLDAGVPLQNVESISHKISSSMQSASSYSVSLKNETTIPNKDFVLRYEVAGASIEDAVMTHRGSGGGYFTMILQPPDKVRTEDVTPKEIVFVLDTSGSMSGFPIEKAKEAMKLALDGLNPYDTFNLITFAGETKVLFKEPVQATEENLKAAQEFLSSRRGGGGTEMMTAIKTALEPSDSQEHIRIVCFMTDGYIGNDMQILGEIRKHSNARIFSFGIGSSVNRYLLSKMAEEGRGEVEFVSLNDDGSAAAKRFHERVRSPLLTDIEIEYKGIEVADTYPKKINDLFSAKPLIIHGRYTRGGNGKIILKGRSFGREVVREIAVRFPENEPEHDVLATLWARSRVADLVSQDYSGVQSGNPKPEIESSITSLGIEFGLMTQFTSFVAVEERVVTDGGKPVTIQVPVELPEGVSYEGVFGDDRMDYSSSLAPMARKMKMPSGTGYVSASPKIAMEEKVDVDGRTEYSREAYSITPEKIAEPRLPKIRLMEDRTVKLNVEIDGTGKVTKAVVSGSGDAISNAARSSALSSTFKLPKIEADIDVISGDLVYVFGKDGKVTLPKMLTNVRVKTKPNKYDPAVRTLVTSLANGGTAASAAFVRDGQANLIVRVKALDAVTRKALENAGFRVLTEMASAGAYVGKIAPEKIAALSAMDQVTFISPYRP